MNSVRLIARTVDSGMLRGRLPGVMLLPGGMAVASMVLAGSLLAGMAVATAVSSSHAAASASASSQAVEGLVLNEIMSSNATTIADEFGDFDDWIELVNAGGAAIQLAGLTLTDDPTDPLSTYTFPSRVLAPGEYLLVWADGEPEEGDLHAPFRLSSAGEILVLQEGTAILDQVTFPPIGADQSYGRWPDRSGGWQLLSEATPAAANQHSTQSEEIVLFVNEFVALNQTGLTDEMGEFEDWIEIFNPGPDAVEMEGLFLTDDLSATTQWSFPAMILPPGGFLVVFCDSDPGDGPLHATFRLSGAGEVIGLFGRVASGNALIDSHAFGAQTIDVSEGRQYDGDATWVTFTTPTPGQSNGVNAVELASFDAVVEAGGVRLSWSATFEVDHLGYALERRTVGGGGRVGGGDGGDDGGDDGGGGRGGSGGGAGDGAYRRLNAGWIRPGEPYTWLDTDVPPLATYDYVLVAVDRAGNVQRFGPVTVALGSESFPGADGSGAPPAASRVASIAPNPSRDLVTFEVEMVTPDAGRLGIYDAGGRLVRAWVVRGGAPGSPTNRSITWDGRDHGGRAVAPGTYFYRLSAADRESAGKLQRLD